MGVLILQLRFLGQLAYLQRLKNYGAERFPAKMAPMLQQLEAAIGINKPVRYLSSFQIGSPFTAGWWRPVVLFPATLLAELNEPELRTIIAHELAHVKRHDFLVNLGQTLVCILFFYHPAVWWMWARIEDEREHCCDDLAIAVTGEAPRWSSCSKRWTTGTWNWSAISSSRVLTSMPLIRMGGRL